MTQSNRILLAVVGAIVAGAAFYYLVLSPKREEAAELQTQVATAQQALDSAKATLATYEQSKKGYERAYTAVVRLGKAVPADDDVRSLMIQLESAAKKTKVDFRTIDVGQANGAAPAPDAAAKGGAATAKLPPGVTVGAAGFPVMPFTFTFKGKFFRLSDFFASLERFVKVSKQDVDVRGRLLTLESVTLEPDQGGFPNIKASVGATSYLVSPTEGLTAGATVEGPAGTTQPGTAAPAGATSPAAPTTATSTGVTR